jgi:hypothetical protein
VKVFARSDARFAGKSNVLLHGVSRPAFVEHRFGGDRFVGAQPSEVERDPFERCWFWRWLVRPNVITDNFGIEVVLLFDPIWTAALEQTVK